MVRSTTRKMDANCRRDYQSTGGPPGALQREAERNLDRRSLVTK